MGLTETVLTDAVATLSAIGVLQILAGWGFVVRMVHQPDAEPSFSPGPITVLKPLHGQEPLLAEALATLCEQDYPAGYQIVFGVGDAGDTAVPVVHALQDRYPNRDIALVIDPSPHGANPKVGNLINMLPAARHDVFVIADSDVHARPDYLRHLADALAEPGVGLVTTLYTGLPAYRSAASLLGTSQVTHGFLPGALLGRALGRHDCLGATMCLSRETLVRIGGLESLRDHLADDNVLGRLVQRAGLDVVLARAIVATTVPERRLAELWRHELRWARTIRSLEPVGFAASILQYPLFWAVLAVILSGGAVWTWMLVAGVWAIRALAVTGIDRALRGMLGGLAFRSPVWLLPLRDILSVAEWLASYAGRHVDWRGLTIEADRPFPLASRGPSSKRFSLRSDTRESITKGSHAR